MVRSFRDMSLRTKLFGGYGLVLLLTVIVGVVLLSEIGNVNSGGVYIATNSLPSVEVIDQIRADENGYRADQLWNITNTDPKLSQAPITAAAAAAVQIESDFHRYRSMISNSQDAHLLATAQSQWATFTGSTGPLLLAASNTTQRTTVALANSSAFTFSSLTPTISAWVGLNGRLARSESAANASTYSSAKTIGIALVVIAVLLGLGIAFLISSSIKRTADVVLDRLASLCENGMTWLADGLQAFARGDLTLEFTPFTPPIENPSKDELGQIATHVNVVRDKMRAAVFAYNETAERLRETIGRVAQTAGSVGFSSHQMAATSDLYQWVRVR